MTTPRENPDFKFTLGGASLMILFVLVGVFICVYFGASGAGAMETLIMLVAMIGLFLPLTIASLITGIIAIAKNKGRQQGILAVCGDTLFLLCSIPFFMSLYS